MLIFIIYVSTCYLTKKNVYAINICHVAEGIFLSQMIFALKENVKY